MANFEITGYEIYELLGRGGMATVYRALHLNLDREVAIKVMDTSLNTDETFSERFIREARISARLTHPHILQIYDVNSFDTLNYISMELLEGGDLADTIRGDMKQSTIYQVMEQMTEALDYASGKGYVHRDIKPSNIMLRNENEYVLADFGIAKAANSGTQMTQTGLMVGTPSYMSPEQAKGIEVDGRSDLYSLAVLCFEMLTKELPYDSDSAVSTAVKHLTEDIPKLPEALSAYQPWLDKALAKSADDRYQTGREMYEAFCEVRPQFSDDDVLVKGKALSERKQTGAEGDDSRTSIAWDDSTRVVAPSRPSRPYKLSDTSSHREPLVSGIRSGQRAAPRTEASGGKSKGFLVFISLVVVGALGFGGYTYWQKQQSGSGQDLRQLTSELAKAYSSLNNDDFERAAISFRKVLQLDGDHAAAKQGLSEVGASYIAAIEAALSAGDLPQAERLFMDYSLSFSGDSNVERLMAVIDQAKQEKQLVSAQSDRIDILVERASTAMSEGKLFEPAGDNAYEYLQQGTELDATSGAVGEGYEKLTGAALEQVYGHVNAVEFAAARDLISRVRGFATDMSALAEAEAMVAEAEATELRRQERWAGYSEEQKQEILERLARAEDLLAKGVLTTQEEREPGQNASELFAAVLELDPENESALLAPERIANAYIGQMEYAISNNQFDDAEAALANAVAVAPDSAAVQQEEEKLAAAREAFASRSELQGQIDDLLSQATDELVRVDEGPGHAQEAVRLYREVLALDPASEAASSGIEQVAEYYISRANESIAYGEFPAATAALNNAQALAPERQDIASMIESLSAQEAEWLTGQNVTVLIESAQQLAQQGEHGAAAEKFNTALKLDKSNSAAQSGLNSAVESFVEQIRADIDSGNFANVGNDLADARVLDPQREDIAQLQADLPALEAAWNEQQQLAQGIEDAQALYSNGRYSKAAAAYAEIMASNPDYQPASEGFEKSIAALVRYANQAIDKGDFPAAKRALASATGLSPEDAASASLLAQLPALEQEWQAEQTALAEAQELATQMADTGLAAVENGDLQMAADTYEQLAAEHPDMEQTLRLKSHLLTAYVEATRQEISNGQFDTAEDYLNRGQTLAPNHAAWGELEEEIEVSRNSSRRRLGAY